MTESSTNPVTETPKSELPLSEPSGSLDELNRLESELKTAKPSQTGGGTVQDGESPRRRKFKKIKLEHTVRLTLRQYWRFRDWMARRALGLPSEYAGVFFTGKDEILIEPLVEPAIGCLETYLPENWIVFLEEKSPILMMLLALFEAEQSFGSWVDSAAREVKSKQSSTRPSEELKFPGREETEGRR